MFTVYTVDMKEGTRKGGAALNMNISPKLLERLERYWRKRMFKSRTHAMEFLLDYALRQDPKVNADAV